MKNMMKRWVPWVMILVMMAVIGCAPEAKIPQDYEIPLERNTFSFDQGMYPSDLDLFLEYRIQPGDILDVLFQIQAQLQDTFTINLYHILEIKFPDLPEMTVNQKILPTGNIVLPYIGEFHVLGMTLDEATEALEKAYEGILLDPEIFVRVVNIDVRIEQLRRDLHTAPRGLSKLVTVRSDGFVTFPLIGDKFVAHKTIKQVNKLVQGDYESYLAGMQVDVFLHEQQGSTIYVLGEVNRPGAYEIKKPTNVLEAVSRAGSFTADAKIKSTLVFRRHEKKLVARRLDLHSLLSLNETSEFFFLRPDDIIFIPKTQIATLANLMRQIADIALFEGWGMSGGTIEFIDDTIK